MQRQRMVRSAIAVAFIFLPARARGQQQAIADSVLDLDGAHLHYRVAGTGPYVVLIHGFAGTANDLSALRNALVASRTTISVDIRSFGQSTGPHRPGGADTAIVEDVARVMGHLHISRADVVGFSMGAVLATRLTLLHPALVRSLVLVSAAPMLQDAAHTFWDPVADDLERGRGLTAVFRGVNPVGAPPPTDSVIASFSRQLRGTHDPKAWAAVARGMPALSFGTADIGRIAAPTLVVYGADDPLMRGHSAWLSSLRTARVDTVPGAGHGNVIRHASFLSSVREFLDSGRPRRTSHRPAGYER